MQRKLIAARPVRAPCIAPTAILSDVSQDWIMKNAANGLTFHNNADGTPYWGEGLVYEIPQDLADRMRDGAQVRSL